MNKNMVARELVVIAKLLAADSAVAGDDIRNGIATFEDVERALKALAVPYETHWSFGTADDPALEDMMAFAGKLRDEARKLLPEFKRKMFEWEKAAKR